MEIKYNAIETDRAYVRYNNIQHISWAKATSGNFEVKIHTSNNNPIIQLFTKEEFDNFLNSYKDFFKRVNK